MVWIFAIAAFAFLAYEVYMNRTAPGTGFISALASAIAKAEGSDSSINNPGDLTSGDVPAENITGVFNSAGVVIIDTIENGWAALTKKLENIMSGNSSVYSPDMTISEFAQIYTGGDNADSWANSVAGSLGVTPDTTLSEAQAQYGE
jgi:hypothetical protein